MSLPARLRAALMILAVGVLSGFILMGVLSATLLDRLISGDGEAVAAHAFMLAVMRHDTVAADALMEDGTVLSAAKAIHASLGGELLTPLSFSHLGHASVEGVTIDLYVSEVRKANGSTHTSSFVISTVKDRVHFVR